MTTKQVLSGILNLPRIIRQHVNK